MFDALTLVARIEKAFNAYKILVVKPLWKYSLEKPRRLDNNINMDPRCCVRMRDG